MRKQTLRYELLLLLVSLLWGSTFVAQQIGMRKGLGPTTFNALRFTLACQAFGTMGPNVVIIVVLCRK